MSEREGRERERERERGREGGRERICGWPLTWSSEVVKYTGTTVYGLGQTTTTSITS